MLCEVSSWIPAAVASTLRDTRSPQPIIAWLTNIRASIEEYDPLITVKQVPPDSEDEEASSTPDSAFDEILSQLGKEIYKLDEYQKNLTPDNAAVSLSILDIFDKCLEGMSEIDEDEKFESLSEMCCETKEINEVNDQSKESVKLVNGESTGTIQEVYSEIKDAKKMNSECGKQTISEMNGDGKENGIDDSDCESTLSDVSFVTSTPASTEIVNGDKVFRKAPVPPPRAINGMNSNVKQEYRIGNSDCESTLSDLSFVTSTPAKNATTNGHNVVRKAPVPPPRTRLKTPSITSSIYDNLDFKTDNTDRRLSDTDSESTCWSYKECSTDCEAQNHRDPKDSYAVVWSHSSGFHNSDRIIMRVISQHHAVESQIPFDTTSDLSPTQFSVYSLQEVGDDRRCNDDDIAVDKMTPEGTEDVYEPVRDALTTDENIYEEIEYGYSYTDEGCSCEGSVLESCSISASSEGVGRESPLYANLRDNDAYAMPPDVIFWKNLLLHPFYNDDEEDEWITPEECAVYSREQRPPLVIPRITHYKRHAPAHIQDKDQANVKSSPRQYERFQDWSPSERGRGDLDRAFSKASSDSPPFVKINRRLGGSTENLLTSAGAVRPRNLPLPASSSGDSLDVEVREKTGYARSRKSRSMVAPKHVPRSPVPAPRTMIGQSEPDVILEGPMKRTKFFEGSKKCRKNWVDCYMILTPTALVFYKDQKTYQASKAFRAPGTPPSPTAPRAEMVLPLLNANIKECIQMHTRRYTKSLVLTVNYDQYLLQDESEERARRWLNEIQNVYFRLIPLNARICYTCWFQVRRYLQRQMVVDATRNEVINPAPPVIILENCVQCERSLRNIRTHNLPEGPQRNVIAAIIQPREGQPRLEDFPTHYKSSTTDVESIGRTPPVSRHNNRNQKAGGSSNEDLSDSTDFSLPKSKEVKRKLRNFFARRPTMDALVQKGIYQDEQIFGRNLEDVVPKEDGVPKVPAFVVECVKEIESNVENMCTDGLYRASGNLSQVQKIRLEVDNNNMSVIANSTDIHVLTGSLKLFFRELKEPLIPWSLFDRVLAACSIKPKEAKIKEFRNIVKALPQCNRDTLQFLLEHLLRVTKYSERNRMHTANLAIVFGPTLLWAPAAQAHNIAIDCIQQNHVVEILLNDYYEIFNEEAKAKKKT